MENAEYVDYSYPTMMAHKFLKEVHTAMLVHNHEGAREAAFNAMAEIKLVLTALAHMKETYRG